MKSLTDLLAGAARVIGTWTQIGAPEVIDILGATGFDFTILDAEHGSFGMDAIENLVRACDAAGVVPIVRIPDASQSHITRALDAGAQAVVVPGIRSAAEAAAAIDGGRFAPAGRRGACPCVRAGDHWIDDWPAYSAARERETGVIVLAETPGALQEIDPICALPDLRALLVGPFDLAVAMGYGGNTRVPAIESALKAMVASAAGHKVPVIMPIFSPDLSQSEKQLNDWTELGVRMFTIGTDKILLHSQARRFVSGMRASWRAAARASS